MIYDKIIYIYIQLFEFFSELSITYNKTQETIKNGIFANAKNAALNTFAIKIISTPC